MFLKKIKTFWHMPIHKKCLFFINFCLCGLAKSAILIFPYRYLSRTFGHRYPMTLASTLITPEQRTKALGIRRDIRLAARFTPWDSSCLTQAMVAKFWCQYHSIPYFMFIGLPKDTKQPIKDQIGHAWLTTGPIAITGGYAFAGHHVILSYSNYHLK